MTSTTAVIDLLRDLVRHDTTSATSNLDLVDHIVDVVGGVASVTSRTFDDGRTKANVLLRVGPEAPGGIVLCGHLDCVPANPANWSSDPFTLTEVGDRLVGRGTADKKGFVAMAVDVARGVDVDRLRRPLWLAFTYDEEVGTLGAPGLVEDLVAHGAEPEAVIIGEPTELRPITAHKGIRAFRVVVTGEQGHSSRPDLAANAAVAAARIATFIDDLAQRQATEHHPPFVPPYTTFNVGLIQAGSAINIIPPRAELWFEYRPVPADDSFDLLDEVRAHIDAHVVPDLRRTFDGAAVDVEVTAVSPALAPEPDGAAMHLVQRLLGTDLPGGSVSFGTDGSHFQAAGLSTVICGPGSIDVAHRPDEFITQAEVAGGIAMLAGVPELLSTDV